MRYSVVVLTDSHSRCFGTFSNKDRADAFAAKVNTAIEKQEEREFAEWQARPYSGDSSYGSPEDMAPEGYGRAVVLIVREPRVRAAIKFASGDYS